MKNVFLLTGFIFITAFTTAQPGNTPGQKKPPSAEEMKKKMEEAMKKMTPEEKEQMKKMGFDKAMENVKKMDGKQLQDAIDNANRPVPIKDVARIAAISQKPLTSATIPAHLTSVHTKVITVLIPAAKQAAENIYTELKTKFNAAAIGKQAVGLWIMGRNEVAIYLMGKACIDEPANTDNISNYAAMLSMNAGEHLALPFLNYLNAKFPENSTILNNTGQAWFGLGEIAKAEKYLDNTIRIYANHPQANFTKSAIHESKGEMAKAVEAAKKSIKHGYTTEKEDRLRRLGYELKPEDLSWDKPMPQDPLGLEKFAPPPYPKSVNESEGLEKDWKEFIDLVSQEEEKLSEKLYRLAPEAQQQQQQRIQESIKAAKTGSIIYISPPLSTKAAAKLGYLIDDKDGSKSLAQKRQNEAKYSLGEELERYDTQLSKQMAEIEKKYEGRFGEGRENPFAQRCGDWSTALNTFLTGANTLLEQGHHSYLEFIRKKTNDEVYYYQYTQWEDEFEVTKLRAKMMWLGSLKTFAPKFYGPGMDCQNNGVKKPKSYKFAEFDDVACKYHSELKLPCGSISVDCSRMTTKFDCVGLKLGLKQNMDRIGFRDQFISATVEVDVEVGKEVEVGPLTVGATVGAGVGIEIDRTGITDVFVTGKAGVSAGAGPVNVEAGVEGRKSIVSGKGTVDGTGIFKGLK